MKNNFNDIKKTILTLVFTVVFCGFGFGQLSSGDIAFIQYNSDNTDDFAFVALVDIPGNEVIKFTDNEESDLSGGEGTIEWTAPSGGISSSTIVTITTTPSATSGSVTEANDLDFAAGGDNLIAYQVVVVGDTTFIAALGNDGATAGSWGEANEGNLPTGLTNGTEAVALSEIDNAKYNGSLLIGTKSELLSAINNPGNWTGDDATNQTFSESFNITSVEVPTNFVATPYSNSQIDLSWTKNGNTDNVIVVFDTDGTFTNPIDGNTYSGYALGGTVIFNGSSTSFNHTSLSSGTQYYYKAWSVDGINNYSAGVTDDTKPLPDIWINEIHYDNDATDTNEFIEIALIDASNYTLSDFTVYLYNGSNGGTYDSKTLDLFAAGTTYDNTTLYTYTYPAGGIQNGPDGMAISWDDGSTEHLIQFLSYEGTFDATDGPANGQTSVDISVFETNTSFTPVGHSLQLVDNNAKGYSDYIWSGPALATLGDQNSDGSDQQTLPIKLTHFTAENNSAFNLIKWTTASEINNAYFTLEKSFNAKEFFEIAQIKGAGNSKSILNYQFQDFETYENIVYYRLKQTDFDGTSTYSEIISIDNNKSENFSILNSFVTDNQININIKSYQHQFINVNITNLNGQIIYSKEIKISSGINNLKIDKINLKNSVYFISIYGQSYLETKKIVNI